MSAMSLAVLLHVVGQHPGGVGVDYATLAVVGLFLTGACAYLLKAQPAPRAPSRRASRPMPVRPAAPSRRAAATALSLLGLSVLVVQGFHVVEHVVVVVQVEALGTAVAQAQGLLGARVDFEWLHLAYNATFLATMLLLLAYGLRHRSGALSGAGWATAVLAGGVALQSYHVGEHVLRIVQYLNTGCTPCAGLIGQAVIFIWPHFLFGVFGYAAFAVAYFAYGLHRELLPRRARRDTADRIEPPPRTFEPSPGAVAPAPAKASLYRAPALEPLALPEFAITERWNHVRPFD